MNAPKIRNDRKNKYAIVVASSAAPSLISRMSSKLVKLLKDAAGILGARTIGVLFVGLAAKNKQQDIGEKTRLKARRLGKKLASKLLEGMRRTSTDCRKYHYRSALFVADNGLRIAKISKN